MYIIRSKIGWIFWGNLVKIKQMEIIIGNWEEKKSEEKFTWNLFNLIKSFEKLTMRKMIKFE